MHRQRQRISALFAASFLLTLVLLLGALLFLAGCEQPREEPTVAVEKPLEPAVPDIPEPVPADEGLAEEEARVIAEASECAAEGSVLDEASYNENTRTWWFSTDIEKPGCNPACVVSEDTLTAVINWRCTGLLPEPDHHQKLAGTVIDACSYRIEEPGTYVLEQNLTCADLAGVRVEASDVVISCNGFAIVNTRPIGSGIRAEGVDNLNVVDCMIGGFTYGMYVVNQGQVTVENSVFFDCNTGIRLFHTDGNTIMNTEFVNNKDGMLVEYSNENTFTDNVFTGNSDNGLKIHPYTQRNTITNNILCDNVRDLQTTFNLVNTYEGNMCEHVVGIPDSECGPCPAEY